MSHDVRTVHLDRLQAPTSGLWARLPLIGGLLGVGGVGASFAMRAEDPEQFAYSWLVAFLYFLSIALGGLFFVLVHFATKSGWGVVVRRVAEITAAIIPLFLLLVIPILTGIHDLFHWSHPEALAHDPILQGKAAWLNSASFTTRTVIYLVLWSLIATFYLRLSRGQDRTGAEATTRRMTRWAGPGIMVFAISVTLAAFDWIMSLDPHWYSTIFGVYYFAGCLVGVFAFMALVFIGLERTGCLDGAVTIEHLHDLGKLLFAFMVFWTYIGFSQFFLIWYGNIPEETVWYMHRLEGNWRTITIFLALGHFAIPFFFLMSRHIKRRRPLLALAALWMLFVHYVDLYWLVMPNLHTHGAHFSLLDLTTAVGIGGLFLAVFGLLLRRQAVVPIGDPRLVESLTFENP